MKKSLLVVAAILAASSAIAREPKNKKTEAPPPAPVVEYENDDANMGEPLGEACLAELAEQETYDSRDNVLITRLKDGGRAFFHFKAGCDTTTMMFADTIRADDGSQCVKPGGALVFTSSYGDAKKCEIVRINRWLDDEPISEEETY